MIPSVIFGTLIFIFRTIHQSGGGLWWIFTKKQSINIHCWLPSLMWIVVLVYTRQWENMAEKDDFK